MRAVRILSVATLIITMAVIVWGAYVRASGSGAGCGDHWPLCNGEVMPRSPSEKTVVELTHRVTSALAGLLVVGLVVVARRSAPKGHPVRRWAGWSLVWMIAEGAAGAALVRLQLVADNASANRAVGMVIHLIITFLLLAALVLTVRSAWRVGPARALRPGAVTATAAAMTLVVGISGAIAALGDTLRQQDVVSPVVDVLIELRILHPVLALVAAVPLLLAAAGGWRAAPSRPWGLAVGSLLLVQLVVGLVNVALKAPIPLQLIHLVTGDLMWMALVLLAEAQSASAAVAAASPAGTGALFQPGSPGRPR